jgi:parallel beta-helix repeat protein
MRIFMKKLAILVILALAAFTCGNSPTNSTNHGLTISISPHRMLVNIGTTFQFASHVEGASNQAVTWSLEGGIGNGIINAQGIYYAPSTLPASTDSVKIIAIAQVDSTKTANAWAVLVDPSKIYVDSFGSDTIGIGTRSNPFRTITKALTRVQSTQLIIVGSGEFDAAAGEHFPLRVPFGVALQGISRDSTFVTCPGGSEYFRDTVFVLTGSATTLEKFHISSANSQGIGVAVRQGSWIKVMHNQLSNNYIGIYASGALLPRPVLDENIITYDSIGIVTADSSGPIIGNNNISNCYIYGIEIRNFSNPDLGLNDSTLAGLNTIVNCGYSNHWLIYSNCPDTIWAIGNVWPYSHPLDNDQFIYDDEESGGASGPVILEQF